MIIFGWRIICIFDIPEKSCQELILEQDSYSIK